MSLAKTVLFLSFVFTSSLVFSAPGRGGEAHGHMDRSNMSGHEMHGRNDQMQGEYGHHDYNRNNEYNGSNVGNYYGSDQYISPTPPPGSQPGMSDDSDSLYNSYQRSNQNQGH